MSLAWLVEEYIVVEMLVEYIVVEMLVKLDLDFSIVDLESDFSTWLEHLDSSSSEGYLLLAFYLNNHGYERNKYDQLPLVLVGNESLLLVS